MRPVLKITRQFDTSPEKIEGDMNRMINGLYDYSDMVTQGCAMRPDVIQKVVRSGTCAASYDTLLRVQPLAQTVVVVQMPPPSTVEGGRPLRIARVGYDGEIVLVPLGSALINGRSQMSMYSTPGLIEVIFDGVNFYSECQGAMAWGEEL